MSDNSVSVLSLGSQSISMGVFGGAKNGLALKKFETVSILADPANEAVRLVQIQSALEQLVTNLGLKKSKVSFAVSGQAIFTKFVKLPTLGADNIEQLVGFEAQQHIPFPIDDVVWDWSMVGAAADGQEVAIVAIKKDLLNDIDNTVLSTGAVTSSVESSQIALANAYLYSNPTATEPTLLIDAGAKSTNLLFLEEGRLFVRSLTNVSGVATTGAISKEYQVDFAQAEEIKVASGKIALNGAYLQEWDEATGALATVISNTVSRLPSEITRTINYYRSQHSGSAPTKVVLAGGCANLPYYKEFIEEKLGLEAEYFNPLTRVNLAKSVDADYVQSHAHMMGDLIGIAAKALSKVQYDIELVPNSIEETREQARKKPFYIGAAAAVIVGSLVWSGAQFQLNTSSKAEVENLSSRVSALKPFEQKLSKLQRDIISRDKEGEQYISLFNERFGAVSRLDEVRALFSSEYLWLESVEDLVDYVPVDLGEEKITDASLVVDNFDTLSYGETSLKTFAKSTTRGKAKEHQINAIKVTGYWRDNPKGQNIVYTILEDMKKLEASSFIFEMDGKALDDNQILAIQSTMKSEEYKAPFTVILPLKETITL